MIAEMRQEWERDKAVIIAEARAAVLEIKRAATEIVLEQRAGPEAVERLRSITALTTTLNERFADLDMLEAEVTAKIAHGEAILWRRHDKAVAHRVERFRHWRLRVRAIRTATLELSGPVARTVH